ncbi:hypothetical protein ACQJBY_052216 [Aegilops geniculata]
MAWNRNGGAPNAGGLPPRPPPILRAAHVCPHCGTQCATARSLALHILWHSTRAQPGAPRRTANPMARPPVVPLPAAAPRPVAAVPPVAPPVPVEPLVVVPPPPAAPPAVHGGARSTVRRLTPNSEFWKEYRSGGDPPAEIDFLGQWESSSTTAQPLADSTDEETDGSASTLA